MKAVLDTLVGRAVLIVLGGILAVQLSSQWIYETALTSEAAVANQERLADRIVTIYHSVARVAPEVRDATAHDLSGGAVEAHWGARPRATGTLVGEWANMRALLVERLSDVGADGVLIGPDQSELHIAMISVRLLDQSWVSVGILAPHYHPPRSWQAILTTTLVGLAVLSMAILMIRWLALPLEHVAHVARTFHLAEVGNIVVAEKGPREIRSLAASFNEMQARIKKQVKARTQALAAVSHDLRTPLARLRLRIEDLSDPALRAAVEHDLDEMERMIEATLSYLRGDRSGEVVQAVELVALVGTIADDATDMGQQVSVSSPPSLVVHGRRLALKRALTNLVQNAVKYGGGAEVELLSQSDHAAIAIRDRGPGIPAEKIADLFEPFVRLDESRNSATGGVGLGLTIAQDIVSAHGGKLILRNRDGGGLEAIVELPMAPASRNIS